MNRPSPRAIKERLYTIRKIAKIGPSRGARSATKTNGVNQAAPGAPIFTTPVKNSKAGNGLPTPSTANGRLTARATKPRKRGSASDSEEAELTDESDFGKYPEDASTFFKTPSKTSDKMRLRAVLPKRYVVDEEEEHRRDIGSDDSDFDPNAEHDEKERKTLPRRGIVGDSPDEC